ncbi:MAG TPA: MATE family efflux transporter [Clostridia bacterium]|nr:MATE family efflux transporter [Clostridia bacterium]
MKKSNPLGTEKISKLILKFSVPAIVGMMVNALYNIVDRIYIGNSPDLGPDGLAGITIAFPLMLISLAFGLLFGVGGATLFSIKLGEKKPQEAEKILGNAFLMLILTSLLYTVIGQFYLEPMLTLLGASEATLPYAMEYMRIIFIGAVFQIASLGLNNFMRADGSPKLAMMTMFLGAGINILLDPIFIYVFKMGMSGAALATVLSQIVSFIWLIAYFTGKKSNHRLLLENMKPDPALLAKISSLGMPSFLLQLAGSLLNSVLNKSLFFYAGDIAVSSMGIINSLQTLMIMPIIGLNQGIQPIVSYNYGAKHFDRVRAAAMLGAKAATVITVIGFIVVRVFPETLIAMFNRDPDLLNFTKSAMLTWMLGLPLIGFQVIGANFFQSIAKPGTAMFLTLTRQVIFLIPALIVFPLFWGIDGILYAAPFADVLSTLLTGTWFWFGIKNLGNNSPEKLMNPSDKT